MKTLNQIIKDQCERNVKQKEKFHSFWNNHLYGDGDTEPLFPSYSEIQDFWLNEITALEREIENLTAQRQAIKADLMTIADAHEYEDLRREVEKYFSTKL